MMILGRRLNERRLKKHIGLGPPEEPQAPFVEKLRRHKVCVGNRRMGSGWV